MTEEVEWNTYIGTSDFVGLAKKKIHEIQIEF